MGAAGPAAQAATATPAQQEAECRASLQKMK
jgi:hypothetical protein